MTKRKRPSALDGIQADKVVKKNKPKKPAKVNSKKNRITNRLTADLPDGMKQEISEIGTYHDCIISDLAAYFIAIGLQDYRDGRLNIDEMLVPIRSMRARHGLDFEYTPPPHQE